MSSRPMTRDEEREIAGKLRAWAIETALPFWATTGYDARRGGFHERLDLAGAPDVACPRRTRVQARQIYVYAHAAVLGWHPDAAQIALRGLEFVLASSRSPDARPGYAHSLSADGEIANALRDTYDHAFILLALAWVARATGDSQVHALIDEVLAFIDEHLAAENGGFHEGAPATTPRRQNPHMHMFEAMLALHETVGHAEALPRARRILTLLEQTFLDAQTRTIREYFDEDWRPAPGELGDIIEPGHHAEWAWLLRKYERLTGETPHVAARHLVETACRFSEAGTGFLIDEADRFGRVRKATRRCWPQTELAKAWLAEHEAGRPGAAEKAAQALVGLAGDYLKGPFPGAWYDSLDAGGKPNIAFVPASTFYHLFCAIAEADRLLGTGAAAHT
ncbi:MAG: AGE family epimerase/isomerase [Variibacter sp.]|nr:AGE family epimerase/isomerase [Variibacter sp.]